MKTAIALLSILLLFSCASATDVPSRAIQCGPGQDLEIRSGLDPNEETVAPGRMTFLVEVANNSHNDVTVDAIRIEAIRQEYMQGSVEPTSKTFNQLIEQGTERVFRLPITGHGFPMRDALPGAERGRLEYAVIVSLSNGDAYHCRFAAAIE